MRPRAYETFLPGSERDAHNAVVDMKNSRFRAELLGGHIEKQPPRFGSHQPHQRAPPSRTHAVGRRPAEIDREIGVAHNERHAFQRNVELLGDDLRYRDIDSLCHVDLAAIGRHVAGFVDRQPGIELVRSERRPRRRHIGMCAFARKTAGGRRHAERPRGGQKCAPVDGA